MNATKITLLLAGAAAVGSAAYLLTRKSEDNVENNPEAERDLYRKRQTLFTKFALMQATAEEVQVLPELFFPNNPRVAALMRRYIDRRTSIAENIRMTGWICFPDNPRAAELVRRNILRQNGSKERQELQGYWMEQSELDWEEKQSELYGTNRPMRWHEEKFFAADDPDYQPWADDESFDEYAWHEERRMERSYDTRFGETVMIWPSGYWRYKGSLGGILPGEIVSPYLGEDWLTLIELEQKDLALIRYLRAHPNLRKLVGMLIKQP